MSPGGVPDPITGEDTVFQDRAERLHTNAEKLALFWEIGCEVMVYGGIALIR